jgi:hypothetical protein
MRRLALSQEDKNVRDWLVQECKTLGCEVKIDQMGNIFASRAGTAKDRLPIAMGSHLDTQPAGMSLSLSLTLHKLTMSKEGDMTGSSASNLLSKSSAFSTKMMFKPTAQLHL